MSATRCFVFCLRSSTAVAWRELGDAFHTAAPWERRRRRFLGQTRTLPRPSYTAATVRALQHQLAVIEARAERGKASRTELNKCSQWGLWIDQILATVAMSEYLREDSDAERARVTAGRRYRAPLLFSHLRTRPIDLICLLSNLSFLSGRRAAWGTPLSTISELLGSLFQFVCGPPAWRQQSSGVSVKSAAR